MEGVKTAKDLLMGDSRGGPQEPSKTAKTTCSTKENWVRRRQVDHPRKSAIIRQLRPILRDHGLRIPDSVAGRGWRLEEI